MPKDFVYRPRTANRTRPALIGAVVLVVAIGLLFFMDRFTGGVVGGYARGAGGAARSLAASAGSAINQSGIMQGRASLASENEQLRREIALYAEEIAQAEFMRAENEELRGIVDLASAEEGVSARIVSSHRASPYGTFLIDVGTDDGISNGDLVLTPGGYVLGEVVGPSDGSATVRSVFAANQQVDLVVGDAAFSADGLGGGNARASVPREAEIPIGSGVIAPHYGGRNVGTVMHVESASSSATAVISIRIPVNLDSLRFVYVVAR